MRKDGATLCAPIDLVDERLQGAEDDANRSLIGINNLEAILIATLIMRTCGIKSRFSRPSITLFTAFN